jgi:hypothetical protein
MVPESRSWVQFLRLRIFSAAHNNPHLPCYLLSTHKTRARGHNSHTGGRMLDYSIRGPLAPSISPGFYSCTGRGGSFIMALESGGLKFKPGHAYFTVHNYSCLQKFIRSSSRSTDQWRRSPGWHIVGGMLEPDKMIS